jgi:hypothetical protein
MSIMTHHVRSEHMKILKELGHDGNPRLHYQHYIVVGVVNPFHDKVDMEASAATPAWTAESVHAAIVRLADHMNVPLVSFVIVCLHF